MADSAEVGLTPREGRLLVEVMELEVKNARLIEERWRDTPEEGYPDGPAALAYERSFATGYATAVSAGANRVRSLLKEVKG